MKMLSKEDWEVSIAWSKVATGCVVRRQDGKYLMVQEGQPKVYGLWNIPAGHVDKGESIEHAAVREVKEETGYDVKLIEKIDIYQDSIEDTIKHGYEATIVGGELKPQPGEILDAGWFSYAEITKMRSSGKLRVEWIYDAISRIENKVKTT